MYRLQRPDRFGPSHRGEVRTGGRHLVAVEEQLRRVGEHLLGQPAELLRLLHLEGLIRKVWASE